MRYLKISGAMNTDDWAKKQAAIFLTACYEELFRDLEHSLPSDAAIFLVS